MADEKKKPKVSESETEETPKTITVKFGDKDVEATLDRDGRIVLPEEVQQVMAAGVAAITQAAAVAAGAGNAAPQAAPETVKAAEAPPAPRLGDDMSDKFRGLPIRELIANPLLAAAEAQQKLASVAWDYYQKIAYDDKGGTRTLKFDLQRPIVQDGVV